MNAPDIRSLEIGMLRTFDALMRERSVSRAAARLFLSQPAVSASLGRLREVFGDPLFTRAPHGVVPTPRAQALAPQVESVLAALAALLEGEAFDPARSRRIFRVAGSDHASRLLLPELSRRLVQAGSGARIHWLPPGAWSLAESLHTGTLDIGVIARVHVPQDIATRVLYEDEYVFATRKGHPLAGVPLTMESFCATPQVFLGYGTSTLDDLVDETVQRAGFTRLAQIAVSSFGQIVHQLTHSDHGAVVGRRVALAHAGVLHVHALPFALPGYSSLLCWSPRAEHDAGVQWLRAQVLDILAPEGEAGG
jgi:DNA-binding transcriptional LysR family regulator